MIKITGINLISKAINSISFLKCCGWINRELLQKFVPVPTNISYAKKPIEIVATYKIIIAVAI